MSRQENSDRLGVLKTYKLYIDGKFPRTESGRYFKLKAADGKILANVCQGSRKDVRDAVTAARTAFAKWSRQTAYLRGQILYRVAEMLEGRRLQFTEELVEQGVTRDKAIAEVSESIDTLVYYAGWSDKYPQIFSAVNPVASSHFNFSMPEPTGVVCVLAPELPSLLGLVRAIAPVIIGGNTAVVLVSSKQPLSGITFGEVLHTSDLPSGVVNLVSGFRDELIKTMASHMDVNAILLCAEKDRVGDSVVVQEQAIENLKRVSVWKDIEANPYRIMEFQEIKTTWHPVGA